MPQEPAKIRPKVRFEIFKRDQFTCQYCGRKVPDVTLELDHIHPRAEGGSDDYENLITSCVDCNRGKGATPLDTVRPEPDLAAQAELILEREAQIRAYHAAKAEQVSRREALYNDAMNHWFSLWGDRGYTPWRGTLQQALEELGIGEVKEAMDITFARFTYNSSKATAYFGGILRRKVAESQGRVVRCKYCNKSIVLDPGEDTSLTWFHPDCAPKADHA